MFRQRCFLGLISLLTPFTLHAYPNGLDVYDDTPQSWTSDSQGQAAKSFYENTIRPYADSHTGGTDLRGPFEPSTIPGLTEIVDPNNFLLPYDSHLRFYFIEAHAGFNNSLGLDSLGHDYLLDPGQTSIIFPNASKRFTTGHALDPNQPYNGLAEGDFVDVEAVPALSYLDLFLIADGADVPQATYWTNPLANVDGISHAKMVHFTNSPYYLIAWEDLPAHQSDLDYDDVYVMMELQEVQVPEPGTYLLLASLLVIALSLRSRSKPSITHSARPTTHLSS